MDRDRIMDPCLNAGVLQKRSQAAAGVGADDEEVIDVTAVRALLGKADGQLHERAGIGERVHLPPPTDLVRYSSFAEGWVGLTGGHYRPTQSGFVTVSA